ncbi:type 1 glutamine amidotransferase [Enterococcus cecorum]|uniref:Lipid II isoglutaminyl synthase (glutamine-hydrolyzing) subunit GatD n=1 Tax=Enterococcus cecorum DSM 20682 = ATCC 43198 TaxID=1121864 RepID=S1RLY6_9ENTE|nr:glutamine amidotransferase [Enterococcus cecorum]EOX18950.1 CobB/CobQ-like glutamine amidotransferase [Enterococcus cecorum DSM 20682 = ATCC 43198]ESK61321.1 CobB/CobQ-like glutamine amidotransferase [Enterococcus cecorum DSM 20682 = ATCC 43198]KLO74212.1 adenosylcobyric acid synthase [Enterococcus cecorum]CAI3426456.1 glutamine amidotransferase [Enterococcus cecorum DSM 20682 = ATCC 43198]SQE56783.1 CobB/CobQ-like glutamine amidotransferase [Enterococcus cecorum]
MANYELHLCHLYGNLLNTYGDNGNLLMLQYVAKKMGITLTTEIVSIHQKFKADDFDLIFFGGGQDFEQVIVAEDLPTKKEELTRYIENDGVMLAICGGYQLLGHYYIGAHGEQIKGIGALDHYTLSQENNRFIGDTEIYNEEFDETYYGFENHNGMTFLGKGEKPLGKVIQGKGNNGQDQTEGVIYKNVFGSYFHGPILARNEILAKRLILTALKKKYPNEQFE